MHVVPVPIRDCLQPELRPIDAVFRLYVRTHSTLETLVYDLDDYLTEIFDDEYPQEFCVGDMPYNYTLFTSDDVRLLRSLAADHATHASAISIQPLEVPNHLLRSFEGGEKLKVRGSILIIKSDDSGAARNMEAKDFAFVKKLVVQ